MAYTNKYRIAMLNPGVAGVQDSETPFSIIIQEKDYSGSETILKGSVDAGVIRYLDSQERRYPAIQASELDIHFVSESNFSLEDIITDDDYQYRVLVTYGAFNGTAFEDRTVWYGFLLTDDCVEDAQDDPKMIRLRATDGLGMLKSQELYALDVYNKQTLLQIIERCLSFTGLELDLLIECSVFEQSMFDRSWEQHSEPFSQCKVHTRSFLSDDNAYKDCYSVLESLLGAFQCSLFQQNGRWHIQRKHDRWNREMELGTVYTYPYTQSDGEASLFNYEVAIDQNERYAINADMVKGYISANKYTKLKYDFTQPKDLPRNANFQQGQQFGGERNDERTNLIAYWSWQRPNGSIISTNIPYRKRVLNVETGQEEESYIVLRRENFSADFEVNRIVSEPVEILKGDRLSFSAETRTRYGYDESTESIMALFLTGDDGSQWSYHQTFNNAAYQQGYWNNSFGSVISLGMNNGDDSSQWFLFEFRTPPFPVTGSLRILFFNTTAYTYSNERWFRSFNWDWQFFVNRTTRVNGMYDKITQNISHRNNLEQAVFIGDTPNKVINGALFRASDDTKLTTKWHRQGKNESQMLIRLNDIALFQSSRRLYTKLTGTFLGVTYVLYDQKQIVGPANLFNFPKSPLKEKYYLATNLEISLAQNTFRATLQEFYDKTKDNGDPQGDQKEFSYTYQ